MDLRHRERLLVKQTWPVNLAPCFDGLASQLEYLGLVGRISVLMGCLNLNVACAVCISAYHSALHASSITTHLKHALRVTAKGGAFGKGISASSHTK